MNISASLLSFTLLSLLAWTIPAFGEEVKVGVATPLSGDLAIIGQNITRTIKTYSRHYLRHPLSFVYEDAKLSSVDGLTAYQKLVNRDRVQVLIGATSSNGTLAAKSLVNSSKTPLLSPLTGGSNIDNAGEYFFRVSTSDRLNGVQQAEIFKGRGYRRVVLITEETEYTIDIANFFRKRFRELGGEVIFDENFSPGTNDFRTIITKIRGIKADAIFMLTQSGTPLGIFLKQLNEQGSRSEFKIFTSFVAAANPSVRELAGDFVNGVEYLAPAYASQSPKWLEFLAHYRADHGVLPEIPFHSASTVDSLNWLQLYLDHHKSFTKEGFHDWLLTKVKNYDGLMGVYSLDGEGNSNLGFTEAVIKGSM